MNQLSGKTALITGGTDGIGLATATLFAQQGARVFITGRRQDRLDAAVRDITAAAPGAQVTGIQGDVSSLPDLERLFARIKTDAGHLDIVFANAGIAEYKPLGEITEEHYHRVVDINFKGTLFTVQAALPLLTEGASILLTGSVVGSKGMGMNTVYAATKAVQRSFARNWATELKSRRIRVNVVSPGATDTPGLRGLLGEGAEADKRRKTREAAIPLGRFGHADEIAQAALFLASPASSYVNGVELFVDGGMAQI